MDPEALAAQMKERDQRDSARADSPLAQAPDAVYLDSTASLDRRSGRGDPQNRPRAHHQRKGVPLNDLLIMKFGGTSVGSAERMRAAARLAVEESRKRPVAVVVSAMSKITDLLLDTMRHAEGGDRAGMEANLRTLRERHEQACRELLPAGRQPAVLAKLLTLDRRVRAHRERHGHAQRAPAALGG